MHTVPHTRLLETHHIAELVARRGFRTVLNTLVDAIAHDYRRWSAFDKSSRMACHSVAGVIELMPISDGDWFSVKYVNGHPGNPKQGLPTVMALGALAPVHTGVPVLLSELTLSTALRTAATSVLAARAMVAAPPVCMAVIGNGAQSEFQALAFAGLMGVQQFRLFDVDPEASLRLARRLKTEGLQVSLCHSVDEAVQEADVITTLTADKCKAQLFTAQAVRPGAHINAVGGDCPGKTELHPDVLAAARVVVEYEPQTRVEGDIQQMPADFPVTELWRVLSGQVPGRQHPDQITVFDSVGFALEDFSTLRTWWQMAQEDNLGHWVSLAPSSVNPKDLYGCLHAAHNGVVHAA